MVLQDENENEQPQDFARTTRAHAGEAITDSRAWPGYLLMLLGLISLGLGLTAAGGGFEGWSLITGIATPVLMLGGLAWVLLERKRVKAREGKSLLDPSGH